MNFTIITPSFNYGRFLGECLQSVAEQLEEVLVDDKKRAGAPRSLMIEHIVLDGGSTDDSADVAARFPHVTWIQEPDKGMSDAINKGFERAQGEWVMWLNADDRLKPGVLADMLPLLERSKSDVVYGDWDFVDADGQFQRRMRALKWSNFVHVHHHCYIGSTAAFLRRRTVLDEGFRLRTDFRVVMDGELYARLAMAGKHLEHVPVNVADFRLHGENASQRILGKTRDMDRIMAAERVHVESRAIRRAYGITLFEDPYLNGLVDGVLWIVAKGVKAVFRCFGKRE
jgi:glycosyltransferase involved in cell wall biosynthesis